MSAQKSPGQAASDKDDLDVIVHELMADFKQTKASPPTKTRTQVVRKAKSLASKVFRRDKPNEEVNPQSESPFFNKLPQELRDKVWEFALAPPKDSKPAHFHIYDEVYDSCTYQKPYRCQAVRRAEQRQKQTHIALLLSCRRIHNEAIQYLYDQSNFTFVVFAGLPRKYCDTKYSDRCKSLGKISNCAPLFARIRNLSMIIQPGKNPHVGAYTARLTSLLKALDYGKNLLLLQLIFNYRYEITFEDLFHVRRKAIATALHPLADQLAPRVEAGRCNLSILCWADEDSLEPIDSSEGEETKYMQLFRTLGGLRKADFDIVPANHPRAKAALREKRAPTRELITWDPMDASSRKKCVRYGAELSCLERGAFGADNYYLKQQQPLTRTPINSRLFSNRYWNVSKESLEAVAFLGGYLGFLPITLPLTAYLVAERKREKGEWKSWVGNWL